MKQIINRKHLSTLIFFLTIIAIIKIIWAVIAFLFLPNSGENYEEKSSVKNLYYRVKLSTDAPPPRATPTKKPTTPVVKAMEGYKLLGLYNSKDKLVVTVEKNNKTTILAKGEDIDGFVLVSAGTNYALFKKAGKEFKLSLNKVKNIKSSSSAIPNRNKQPATASKKIVEQEGVKLISRDLLTSYTKNMDRIWNDIGITQNQKNGKLNGFKINYVKTGSDFEKLGLRKGDILMGINGQALDSLNAAMSIFKEINDIENLTLVIDRNGKSEEIEYEIQ